MGLGGYLTWTGAAEALSKIMGGDVKFLPVERHGQQCRIVESEIFAHNARFTTDPFSVKTFELVLNDPETNYCKRDTPTKAYQRGDKHIIAQITEKHGITDPELRCRVDLTDAEKINIDRLLSVHSSRFIVIEPHSKTSYTPNREYSFDKWQRVVDAIRNDIEVLQVSPPGSRKLSGVSDLSGLVTFIEAIGVIGRSRLFLSTEGGLVHGASCTTTKSVVVMTGYQSKKMVCYPNNMNIDIAKHGPCGLKIPCVDCMRDVAEHDPSEIIDLVRKELSI